MLYRPILLAALLFAVFAISQAKAQSVSLDLMTDTVSGAQIGVPRSIPGTPVASDTGVGWKSADGRMDVRTLRFPATRPLDDILQRLRSRKGRQITREEMSTSRFVLEGADTDGAQFIVQVEEAAGEKRGFSVTYRAQGRADIAELARQIAGSYKAAGDGSAPAGVAAAPSSEAELTRAQRQAIQAQLAAHGHKWPETDGQFLLGTRAAIKSYQRTYRGPETGVLTAQDIRGLMQGEVYAREIVRLEGRDRVTVADHDSLGKDKCDRVRTELDAMARVASVRFDGSTAQAGEAIGLSWSFRPQARRHPMYLMIAFDQPVRFSGRGFYVLMPGARAPFGLSHAGGKTRLVVPLYVTGGATTRTIKVTPVLAGALDADAAIVVPTGCGEQSAAVMPATHIAVSPGKPSIEIAEDAPVDGALQTILSPSGDRMIAVTDDKSFQLIASQSGQVIASLPGGKPRFSPTGRFVTALDQENVIIRDAIDGEPLSTIFGTPSWDNKDSFIVNSRIGVGGVEVRFPSVTGETGGHTELGCRPCSGLDESTQKIDLENNLVLATQRRGGTESAVYSLTEELGFSDGMWANTNEKLKYGSAAKFAELVSRVVPMSFPSDWEFIEKPQFPYLTANPEGVEPDSPWRRFYRREMEPVIREAALGADIRPAEKAAGAPSGSLSRAVSAMVPDFDAERRSFARRLADFGIAEHPAVAFQPVADPLKPTNVRKRDWQGQTYSLQAYKLDPKLRIDDQDSSCGEHENAKPDKAGVFTISVQRAGFFNAKLGERTLTLMGGGCMAGSMGESDPVFALFDSRKPGVLHPITSGVPFWEVRNPGGACEGAACDYHALISHERYLLIWSSFSTAIELIDLESRKTVAFAPYRGNAMESVALTPDARMLVQRNRDGTFAIHDVKRGVLAGADSYANAGRMDLGAAQTVVLYGRYADDEVVVWTPSGYFDATYEGAAQVHLRFAGLSDLYGFDQFASIMRRPRLAEAVMRGTFKDEPIAYKVPPTISGTLRGEGERISVTLRQTSGRRIARILLYQDGLHTDDLAPADSSGAVSQDVPRRAGVRWVAAVAIDEDGLVSQPLIAQLGPAPTTRTLRILGVGVDDYGDKLPRLSFGKSDVKRIVYTAQGARSRIYSRIEPVLLADAEATRQAVTDALNQIAGQSSADTDIMLVFAGHGVKGSDGRYYLALAGTETDNLASTALSWDEVAAILARAKSRVLVVLDSCHSGDAGRGLLSTNDDVAAGLVSAAGNVVVLAGSKGREYSIEDASVGGGYFSAAVAEALAKVGEGGNDVLEASELYAAVKRSVLSGTKGAQTPWIARNRMIGDFSVF